MNQNCTNMAQALAQAGISIVPVELKTKKSVGTWKEYQARFASPDEIRAWARNPKAEGIAIIGGKVSGDLEILDFDCGGVSYPPWCDLVTASSPGLLGKLYVEKSPSSGYHVAYLCQGATIPGNTKLAERADGNGGREVLIETRGEAGYCIVSPSAGYQCVQGELPRLPILTPEERTVLIEAALAQNEFIDPRKVKGDYNHAPGSPLRPGDDFNLRGEVRDLLARHGWQLVGPQNDEKELWRRPGKSHGSSATLFDNKVFYVFSSNGHPFEPSTAYAPFAVYAMFEHAGNFEAAAKQLARDGYGAPEAPKGAQRSPSHIDLAQRVIEAYGDGNLIHAQSSFWGWNGGGVWKKLDDLAVRQKIQNVVPEAIRSLATVNSVLGLMRGSVFKDDHKFNAANKFINVKNGELHWNGVAWELKPHNREHYSIAQIPVEFDHSAGAPRFVQFLDEVFAPDKDDKELKAALICQLIGYSLQASTDFETFIILIGPSSANGKSVLLFILELLIGRDNIAAVLPSQFGNKFQRAHLAGKLVNLITELPEGHELADAEMKGITSGETTTGEHKGKDPFEFTPFATPWIASNHLPRCRDFTDATFRRARVIPFNRHFGVKERDTSLKNKQCSPFIKELPGILNLALAGLASVFRSNGFIEPPSVLEAKKAWRHETDQASQFVADCCTFIPGASVLSSKLYQAYVKWANEGGINKKLAHNGFTARLKLLNKDLDTAKDSKGGTRLITGIKLLLE